MARRLRLAVSAFVSLASIGAIGSCGDGSRSSEPAPAVPTETGTEPSTPADAHRSTETGTEPSPPADAHRSTEAPDVEPEPMAAILDRARRNYGAHGAIAVAAVDGVRMHVAVGTADDDGTPADTAMRFRAGSVTKTITAALVLDQVARGGVGLDDDVAAIVGPPLRPTPPVTVRMLLEHTSGIFDIGNEGDPIADIARLTDTDLLAEVDELAQRAARGERIVASARLTVGLAETHPRDFEPGTAWNYSNTNYQLAGIIIEAVSGESFADVLADRLARPLGLTATSLAPHDTSSPEFRGTALDRDTGAELDPTDDLLAFGNGGSGGLLTTADELLTIVTAIVHGPLLPDGLRAEMLEPTALSDHSYGLGIARYQLTCGPFYGHEGRVNGTVTIALVHTDTPDLAVVVTMNRAAEGPDLPALADDLVCGR